MANHTALVARDGREIPIEDSAAPIRDGAGNVLGVVLVFHDVTEKRRAHRELQNVLNSISDGLLVLDRDWRHIYFNEQGARMIGMRREDLIGACIWEVFPHAKGTRFYEEYHRAVETGQPVTFEEYYPEPLNKWFECHCYPSEAGLSVYFHDVTERKRAEEEMAWLASFPERNANPIAEIEPLTGAVQYVNAAGRRLFPDLRERGLSHPWLAGLEQVAETLAQGNGNSVCREVMVGDHCYEQTVNYIAEKERLRIYGIDITERKRIDEALRRSRDELELRVQERTRELSNSNIILSAYIKERERAQAALHESEAAFRTLAESVPQLVWICNPDGLNVYFNQRWVEYTGLTLEESYGRGWNTPFHADDKQAAWQAWNHAVESGDTYRVESRLRRADGSYHWFLIRGVPSRDDAGQIVKWFGTCTDIDDLKQAEQEARSARERLALALKVGLSGTFEWDIRNNVNVWTPEVEELYGLAPGTFGGRYEDWEALVFREDLPHARACLEESLKTGEFFSEWRIRHAGSGEIRWIVANAKVSFDGEGRPVRMIGFNRDITDRKQAELEVLRLNQDLERRVAERTIELERTAAELEKRNREVERVNRMKTDFLARSSHELRTPLNAIVGYADLLGEQSAGPLPPPYPRFVSNIQEGARHLLDMVNDLLDISRIEAGRIELNLERFEVSEVLDEVLSVITPLAEIKRIAVENRVARDTAVVADRLRFKQILYNLTSNAVKFTPEEGRVWIETAMEGEILTISVGDTGIGIAAGEQEAIFEEFHQVASARKLAPAGAGLGLAITRKLARLHGGEVRVESELGKGSRFLVSLPVAAKSVAPERMEANAQGVGSGR
jgi:PAS domain S-box-containing protein